MTQEAQPVPQTYLQRSSRDPALVGSRLTVWLTSVLPPGAAPAVSLALAADSNGMSSETLPVTISHTVDGLRRTDEYVARIAPAPGDVPVFASYRLRDQYEAMRLAALLTEVPVPRVWLLEESGDVLGTPFFLMERVDGIVPPDVLPYPFGGNWLYDATVEQQQALQRRSVAVLAALHAIPDAATRFAFLDPSTTGHDGDGWLSRNLAKTRAWYAFAAEGGPGSVLIARGLAWLVANLPAETDPVLVWGDARIGNTMYRDFTPVAVLDWEMATLGPREMDVAWMIFGHEVFQDIATTFGLPGMPDFLRADDVRATYEQLTGTTLGDLTWHRVHAAVQWGCVFLRTSTRQVHFGEIERPADPESVFHHRALFERLLDEVGA